MTFHHPLQIRRDGVDLAGSLWLPADSPRWLVLMHPGSGPSDRDNDVLFPPIRQALLDCGVAVCSFDKRGVGGSTGRWQDADITDQADDLIAGLRAARSAVGQVGTGLFGHSQGGWVVIEAGSRIPVDFVISNSGPAVTPREQEIFSTRNQLRAAGWDEPAVEEGLATLEAVFDAMSEPFASAWPRIRTSPLVPRLQAAGVFVPADEPLWTFAGRILDHDPARALSRLSCPLLALLGGADTVVPVARSVEVFTATVRADLLDLRVFPGADHRFGPVSAGTETFVPQYLSTIAGFVEGRLRPTGDVDPSERT